MLASYIEENQDSIMRRTSVLIVDLVCVLHNGFQTAEGHFGTNVVCKSCLAAEL